MTREEFDKVHSHYDNAVVLFESGGFYKVYYAYYEDATDLKHDYKTVEYHKNGDLPLVKIRLQDIDKYDGTVLSNGKRIVVYDGFYNVEDRIEHYMTQYIEGYNLYYLNKGYWEKASTFEFSKYRYMVGVEKHDARTDDFISHLILDVIRNWKSGNMIVCDDIGYTYPERPEWNFKTNKYWVER